MGARADATATALPRELWCEVEPPGYRNGRAPVGVGTQHEPYETFWVPWAMLAIVHLLKQPLAGRTREIELIAKPRLSTSRDMLADSRNT